MITSRRTLALALPLIVAATLAAAGPPWISIEYPANPLDPETRGALVVVHTYHHETPIASPIRAEAIGTIDGRRVTAALDVRETSRRGVYAISGDLSAADAWVVTVVRGSGGNAATALIAMNGAHELLTVQVPSRSVEDGRWTVPRAPTTGEVELLLRTASAMEDAARSTRLASSAGAALLLLLVVPSGLWVARRRRMA